MAVPTAPATIARRSWRRRSASEGVTAAAVCCDGVIGHTSYAASARTKSLYDPRMSRTRPSARSIRFAVAFALAAGLAVVAGAAQRPTILTNGRNLQIPTHHGRPDHERPH